MGAKAGLDPIEVEMAKGSVPERDKFVGRGGLQWLMGIPTVLFLVAGLVFAAGGIAAADTAQTVGLAVGGACTAFAAAFAFMWLTLSVIRTALTADSLNVKCGLWGPEVKLGAIEECQIVTVQGIRVGGKRFEEAQRSEAKR